MKLNKTFISVAAILILLLAGILSGCVPQVINVTGVDITEDDQSMKVGDTLQLTAIVSPENADNKNITWESNNPDVASVDENGLVTALSAGTANITVTTEDGDFTNTIKITVIKPTPAIKKYEVNFGVYLIPEEIPAGLTSRGDDTEPNLAGVEIEIFSDEERTKKVTTIITDENGMATVKLQNGTYYFIASKERYICAPFDEIENNPEIITLPTTPVATLTVQGSFTISNKDMSDTILIIARDTYIVTFLATENNTQTFGVSRKIDPSPVPLEGVTIEIYEGGLKNTSITERTAEEPVEEFKITTLTTNSDGIAQVYLINGPYTFTASKEGYADYPSESPVNSYSLQRPLVNDRGYFEVIGADITDTDPVQVPMKPIYTVTFDKNNPDATDASPTTAEVISGNSLGVLPAPPSLACHTFLGWATTNDATEPDFDEGTPIIDDITVYAVWTDDILLYSNGTEYVNFVEGYSCGDGEIGKGDDHLYLNATTARGIERTYVIDELPIPQWLRVMPMDSERTYVIDEPIDLTNIKKIEILWENISDSASSIESYLIISPNKYEDYQDNSKVGASTNYNSFELKQDSIDTSTIDKNNNYYIRVHVRISDYHTSESTLNIYEIKLIRSDAVG